MTMANPFNIIIGTTGEALIPMSCAKRKTSPTLTIGPAYEQHNFRIFAKMPSRADSEKLPVSFGYDRTTVTYDISWLMLFGPLPPGVTARFYSVSTKSGYGKIQKTDLHNWLPGDSTGNFPAVKIELPLLNPGDWISVEGTSRFHAPRSVRRTKVPFPVIAPAPIPTLEDVRHIIVPLQLISKLHWLPTSREEPRVNFVRGSPFDHSPAPYTAPEEVSIKGMEELSSTSSPLNSSGSTTPTSGASPSPEAIHNRSNPES